MRNTSTVCDNASSADRCVRMVGAYREHHGPLTL